MNQKEVYQPFFLFVRIFFLGGWILWGNTGFAQQDTLRLHGHLSHRLPALEHMYLLQDAVGELGIKEISSRSYRRWFHPVSTYESELEPDQVYWGRLFIQNAGADTLRLMLHGTYTGLVSYYFSTGDTTAPFKEVRTGAFYPESQKEDKRGRYANARTIIAPGETQEAYIRIQSVDNNPIKPFLNIWDTAAWFERDLDYMAPSVNFFGGIFFIMMLYNLVVFFFVRYRAYLYYSLYLASVITFMAFSVGIMAESPWGDPKALMPIGYLGFGSIDIFYFLFARAFLKTWELFPKADKLLRQYIIAKIVIILALQIYLQIDFNLFFTLRVEFAMVAVDMIISLILFVMVLRSDSPLARYFVIGSGAVIIVGLSLAICGYFFNWRYVYQGFLTTIVIEIVCFSLGLGDRFRQSERQKVAAEREQRRTQEALNEKLAKLNTAYERFVPHEFLRSIGHDSILDVKLGDGLEKEVTVFFSDIRSYTRIAEQMTPQENFQFLNAYLGRVGPIIQTHRGFVNQYYGDGIMALFLKSPEDALQAAIGIHRVLGYYNAERAAKGRQPIEIGIGIHRGPLMMGIIGDALRMDSGVVSDTVNTAARMEGLTKFFGCRTLVSEATLKTLTQARSFGQRYLGKVQVKGRQEVLGIYDLFDGDPEEIKLLKMSTKADFEEGLAFYFDRNFAKAAHCFDRVLDTFPEDGPAQRYHAYTLKYLVEGVPPDWTGVEMMVHK